jgi:hypothetical protein
MDKEKMVLVGIYPTESVLAMDEQMVWIAGAGHLRVEFDPKRCPFGSNVFQAPPGMRLQSGPPVPGCKPGSYKYRISLNDAVIGTAEVLLREK